MKVLLTAFYGKYRQHSSADFKIMYYNINK